MLQKAQAPQTQDPLSLKEPTPARLQMHELQNIQVCVQLLQKDQISYKEQKHFLCRLQSGIRQHGSLWGLTHSWSQSQAAIREIAVLATASYFSARGSIMDVLSCVSTKGLRVKS